MSSYSAAAVSKTIFWVGDDGREEGSSSACEDEHGLDFEVPTNEPEQRGVVTELSD
jgi:hypothetical protein